MSVTDFSPFLAVHIDLPRNRKTYALARLLSEKRTSIVGMLVSFWAWALENALDGKLDPDPNLLADIMEWEHDKNLLVNSLVVSKWIDIDDNGQWNIHDWDDHTGDFQAKRAIRLQQNREAQKRHRAELKLISNPTPTLLTKNCKTTTHDVSMTSALCQDDVSIQQNRTENNITEPNDFTKEIDKESEQPTDKLRDIFFSFTENTRYIGIDWANEFAKFCEYWLNGHRKLRNPKLACHNWLDRCLERKGGSSPPQPGGGNNSDPDKYIKGKYGHMVQR